MVCCEQQRLFCKSSWAKTRLISFWTAQRGQGKHSFRCHQQCSVVAAGGGYLQSPCRHNPAQDLGAMADIVSVDTFSMPQDPVTCPSQLGTPQPPLDDFSVTPDELFRAKHAINANVHLVPSQLGGGCEPGLVPSPIDDVRWCRWFMVRVSAGSSINMIHHSSECSNTCGFLCPFGVLVISKVFPQWYVLTCCWKWVEFGETNPRSQTRWVFGRSKFWADFVHQHPPSRKLA